MLKFLLILFLLGYVVIRGISFFIRMILGGPSMNPYGQQQQQQKRRDEVNVDYVARNKDKDQKRFEGGEYVDFEEVN